MSIKEIYHNNKLRGDLFVKPLKKVNNEFNNIFKPISQYEAKHSLKSTAIRIVKFVTLTIVYIPIFTMAITIGMPIKFIASCYEKGKNSKIKIAQTNLVASNLSKPTSSQSSNRSKETLINAPKLNASASKVQTSSDLQNYDGNSLIEEQQKLSNDQASIPYPQLVINVYDGNPPKENRVEPIIVKPQQTLIAQTPLVGTGIPPSGLQQTIIAFDPKQEQAPPIQSLDRQPKIEEQQAPKISQDAGERERFIDLLINKPSSLLTDTLYMGMIGTRTMQNHPFIAENCIPEGFDRDIKGLPNCRRFAEEALIRMILEKFPSTGKKAITLCSINGACFQELIIHAKLTKLGYTVHWVLASKQKSKQCHSRSIKDFTSLALKINPKTTVKTILDIENLGLELATIECQPDAILAINLDSLNERDSNIYVKRLKNFEDKIQILPNPHIYLYADIDNSQSESRDLKQPIVTIKFFEKGKVEAKMIIGSQAWAKDNYSNKPIIMDKDRLFPFKLKFEELLIKPFFKNDQSKIRISDVNLAKVATVNPLAKKQPQGVSVTCGGRNAAIFLKEEPNYVFKMSKYEEFTGAHYYENYMRRVRDAQKVCSQHNLYLFEIPNATLATLDGPSNTKKNILIQKKVELEKGSTYFQKSFWFHLLDRDDPQIVMYMKELLKQLAIFIIYMNYEDVRFDNIPLTKDGRIAIFDLDNDGDAITGLVKGTTVRNKINGLFQMVPIKWFDEILQVIMTHLPKDKKLIFEPMIVDLRIRAEKRAQKRKLEKEWFKNHGINNIEDKITFNMTGSFSNFQKIVNGILDHQKNYYDLITGRKIHSGFNFTGQSDAYIESQRVELERQMALLKAQGKIYKFKIYVEQSCIYYSVLL